MKIYLRFIVDKSNVSFVDTPLSVFAKKRIIGNKTIKATISQGKLTHRGDLIKILIGTMAITKNGIKNFN
ncbi:MAG: hypothetical protein V1858_04490 [Candidatus Gottesmanbacteria bacterium]